MPDKEELSYPQEWFEESKKDISRGFGCFETLAKRKAIGSDRR